MASFVCIKHINPSHMQFPGLSKSRQCLSSLSASIYCIDSAGFTTLPCEHYHAATARLRNSFKGSIPKPAKCQQKLDWLEKKGVLYDCPALGDLLPHAVPFRDHPQHRICDGAGSHRVLQQWYISRRIEDRTPSAEGLEWQAEHIAVQNEGQNHSVFASTGVLHA
jgi:hypothetical protein